MPPTQCASGGSMRAIARHGMGAVLQKVSSVARRACASFFVGGAAAPRQVLTLDLVCFHAARSLGHTGQQVVE